MNSYILLATLTEEPALKEHLNVASADGHILMYKGLEEYWMINNKIQWVQYTEKSVMLKNAK